MIIYYLSDLFISKVGFYLSIRLMFCPQLLLAIYTQVINIHWAKLTITNPIMNQLDKLIKSVRKDDVQKVSEILQSATLNINELDPKSGKSLLQIAMESSTHDIFSMLISYPGIDVEKPSRQGELPLETAILLNNYQYVEKLLSTNNINPKRKNSSNETALEIAVKNLTSPDIIKKLLQFKFDINQPVAKHGNLINLAIVNNQLQNLLFLLNYGLLKGEKKDSIKLNTMDEHDNSCLTLAVEMNLGDAVMAVFDYLSQESCPLTDMEKQFFVNHQNLDGNTALHLACLKDLQTISSIIQMRFKVFGLDLTLKNKKGLTISEIRQQLEKQRQVQRQMKEKSQQEKRVYLKEKEEEKQRRRDEEERARVEEKRRKKEEELVELRRQQYQNELTQNKAKWICGILAVAVIALMYLVLLNSVESKKNAHI